MREVTPEYDAVVAAWTGLSKDTWAQAAPEVKEKFYNYYDKAQNPEEKESEEDN